MSDQEAFVLAVDDTTVTFFALGIGIQVRDLVEDDEIPEPGNWCTVFEDDYIPSAKRVISNFEVFNKDGVCHIQLFASTPNWSALPKYMRNKFNGAVWSPFVQYLNDKNGILREVTGGEVVEVIVKYAPFENKLFEVVSLVDWADGPKEESWLSVYRNTPWLMEYLAREMRPFHEVLPDQYGCINQLKTYTTEQVAVGVCIVHKAPNPAYLLRQEKNLKASDGSEQFTSWLWSPIFGLTRWLIRPDVQRTGCDFAVDQKTLAEINFHSNLVHGLPNTTVPPPVMYEETDGGRSRALGKWFAYRLNDPRWREKKKGTAIGEEYTTNKPTMEAATASDVKTVGVEKPFRVVPKEQHRRLADYDTVQLEMEVSFPFKREDIEDDKGNVKLDAYFYDLQLGKVEIYPPEGLLILKKVDEHLKELQEKNTEEYEKANGEVFIIVATVTLIRKFYENAKTYPEHGLFLVKWIDQIKYLHGGRCIYQKE